MALFKELGDDVSDDIFKLDLVKHARSPDLDRIVDTDKRVSRVTSISGYHHAILPVEKRPATSGYPCDYLGCKRQIVPRHLEAHS